MEQDTGLTVALILVAIAVLMQAEAMLGIWLAIRKIPGQIESVRSDIKQRLDPKMTMQTDQARRLFPERLRKTGRA